MMAMPSKVHTNESIAYYSKSFYHTLKSFSTIFFLTITAAVYLTLFICQVEYLGKLLLYGGDASRVLAADHIDNLVREL